MIGALNKLFRKTASLKGKDIFDKRLIKASYSGDMKEPKEKHVLFILECLKGKHLELIRPKEALRKVSDRFFNNLKSLSLMVKALIILHRALQEEDISQTVAHKIKEMENILQPCQNDDQSYDLKMQCFISDLYINYIKNLINFIIISQLFQVSLKDLHHYSRSLQLIELFLIFTRIDTLIECIVKVFEQKAYCQNYRLFHSVIYLLFVDLLKIYQSYYLLVTVMLEKFEEMDLKDSKRSFIIYLNFIKVNREIRKMAAVIVQEFNIKLKLHFYDIDTKVVDALKQSIELRERKLKRGGGGSSSQENVDSSSDNLKLKQRDVSEDHTPKMERIQDQAMQSEGQIKEGQQQQTKTALLQGRLGESKSAKKQSNGYNYAVETQGSQGGQMTIPIFEGDQRVNFSNAMRQATIELGALKPQKRTLNIENTYKEYNNLQNQGQGLINHQNFPRTQALNDQALQSAYDQILQSQSADVVKRSYTQTMDRMQMQSFKQRQKLQQEDYLQALQKLQANHPAASLMQQNLQLPQQQDCKLKTQKSPQQLAIEKHEEKLMNYMSQMEKIQEEEEAAMNINKFTQFADELLLEDSPEQKIQQYPMTQRLEKRKMSGQSTLKIDSSRLAHRKISGESNQKVLPHQEQTFGLRLGQQLSEQHRQLSENKYSQSNFQGVIRKSNQSQQSDDDEEAFRTVFQDDPIMENFKSANEDRYEKMFSTANDKSPKYSAQAQVQPSSDNYVNKITEIKQDKQPKDKIRYPLNDTPASFYTKPLIKVQSEYLSQVNNFKDAQINPFVDQLGDDQSSINKPSKESFFIEADSFIIQKSSNSNLKTGNANLMSSQSSKTILNKNCDQDFTYQNRYGLKILAAETQSYNPRQSNLDQLSSVNSASDLSAQILSYENNYNFALNLQSQSQNHLKHGDPYQIEKRKMSYFYKYEDQDSNDEEDFKDANDQQLKSNKDYYRQRDQFADLQVGFNQYSIKRNQLLSGNPHNFQRSESRQSQDGEAVDESFRSCVQSNDYE